MVFMIVLGVVDGAFGMVLLKRAFLGISEDPYSLLFRIVGLLLRLLGLGAISLFAIQDFKFEKLPKFILFCILMGFTAGLWIFLIRGGLMTAYVLAQKQVYWFDFLTFPHALTLMGFCAFICTIISVLARAMLMRRARLSQVSEVQA